MLPIAAGKTREPNLPNRLSTAEFKLLCAAGQSRDVAVGETIFRVGEVGRSMYVASAAALARTESLSAKLLIS